MSLTLRQFAVILASALASTVSGCGSINEKLSAGVADALPQWAGGLPPDAPPRPGTAKYEEYMRERERQRLMPAAEREREQQSKTSPSGLDPVH